jgi:hypothetical protein
VAIAILVVSYDAFVNARRSLDYLASRNSAHPYETLARAISASPRTPRYYVSLPVGQFSHRIFQALTHNHSITPAFNLMETIPAGIDSSREAVVAVTNAASVDWVRSLYPQGDTREVVDPTGRRAGFLVHIPAHATPSPVDPPCGLRRQLCVGGVERIDPLLVFYQLGFLCPDDVTANIEWRGILDVPGQGVGLIDLHLENSAGTIEIDGNRFASGGGQEGPQLPARIRPGKHDLLISVAMHSKHRVAAALRWQLPGEPWTVVPCPALRPD